MDDRGIVVRYPAGLEIYVASEAPTPVLGPTLPAVHWVPGSFSPEVNRLGRQPHLMLRLRMNGAILPLPHISSWCAQGKLPLCLISAVAQRISKVSYSHRPTHCLPTKPNLSFVCS
jgi:hypothetical protein